MLLKISNMDVYYGKAKAVHDVNLEINEGEMVFLVGRNGAGKTTLMKTVAGFLVPTRGEIIFNDSNLQHKKPEQIALSGLRYVFQDKRVITKLTVRENIHLAAHPFKVKHSDAVDKVCSIYPRIEKFLDIKAGGLSGGQKQLLLIGRALIGNPKLLLLDEPTEGLAAGIIEEVFLILEQLKGEVSMLTVEQNLDLVTRLADRVYAMKEGSIIQEFVGAEEINNRSRLENLL